MMSNTRSFGALYNALVLILKLIKIKIKVLFKQYYSLVSKIKQLFKFKVFSHRISAHYCF